MQINQHRISITSNAFRIILLSLVWLILADASMESWWIGLPAVLFARAISFKLIPITHFNLYEFFTLFVYFIIRSLIAGVNVARRAFHPKLPMAPALRC